MGYREGNQGRAGQSTSIWCEEEEKKINGRNYQKNTRISGQKGVMLGGDKGERTNSWREGKKKEKKSKHTKREEIIRWRESQKVCVRDSSEARREGKDRLSSYRYEKRKKEKSANLVGPFG